MPLSDGSVIPRCIGAGHGREVISVIALPGHFDAITFGAAMTTEQLDNAAAYRAEVASCCNYLDDDAAAEEARLLEEDLQAVRALEAAEAKAAEAAKAAAAAKVAADAKAAAAAKAAADAKVAADAKAAADAEAASLAAQAAALAALAPPAAPQVAQYELAAPAALPLGLSEVVPAAAAPSAAPSATDVNGNSAAGYDKDFPAPPAMPAPPGRASGRSVKLRPLRPATSVATCIGSSLSRLQAAARPLELQIGSNGRTTSPPASASTRSAQHRLQRARDVEGDERPAPPPPRAPPLPQPRAQPARASPSAVPRGFGGAFEALASLGPQEQPGGGSGPKPQRSPPKGNSPPSKRSKTPAAGGVQKRASPPKKAKKRGPAGSPPSATAGARNKRSRGAAARGGGGGDGDSSSDDGGGPAGGGGGGPPRAPAGAPPAAPPPAAARAHAGRTPMIKTVNMGLYNACIDPEHARELELLAVQMTEILHHGVNILGLYAMKFVEMYNVCHEDGWCINDKLLDEMYMCFFVNPNARRKGELFNQSTVQRAFALARSATLRANADCEEALLEAADEYFDSSDKLRNARETRPFCKLLDGAVVKAQADECRVSFATMYGTNAWQAQREALKKIHGLSGKQVKLVQERLGTSKDEIGTKAAVLATRAARHAGYVARREVEGATAVVVAARGKPAITAAKKALAAAEKRLANAQAALAKWNSPTPKMKKDALAAMADKAWPVRKLRQNMLPEEDEDEDEEPLTLEEIYDIEFDLLPPSKSHVDQLVYRAGLEKRIKEAGRTRKFNLTPESNNLRHNTSIMRGTLKRLLNEPEFPRVNGKRISFIPVGDTFQDLLPRVFTVKALRRAENGWYGFGPTFQTDGVTLHLQVCNQACLRDKEGRQKAMQGGKLKKAQAIAAGTVFIPKGRPAPKGGARNRLVTTLKPAAPSIELPRPPGAINTYADFGNVNVGGFCRDGYDESAKHVPGQPRGAKGRVAPTKEAPGGVWTYTTAAFRHDTGDTRRRQRVAKQLRKRRRADPEFRAAEDSLKDLPNDFSQAAVHARVCARGAAFAQLYDFYGSHQRARDRANSFDSKRRVLLRTVKGILRTNNDYLLYGDAEFAPHSKGLPPGVGGALVGMANWYMPGHAKPRCEWRTSKIAPYSHEVMSSPPKKMMRSRTTGKRYIATVFGLKLNSVPHRSVLWNRDISAPLNLKHMEEAKETKGDVPFAFRKSTLPSELVTPDGARRRYRKVPGVRGFVGHIPPLPAAAPAPSTSN